MMEKPIKMLLVPEQSSEVRARGQAFYILASVLSKILSAEAATNPV